MVLRVSDSTDLSSCARAPLPVFPLLACGKESPPRSLLYWPAPRPAKSIFSGPTMLSDLEPYLSPLIQGDALFSNSKTPHIGSLREGLATWGYLCLGQVTGEQRSPTPARGRHGLAYDLRCQEASRPASQVTDPAKAAPLKS